MGYHMQRYGPADQHDARSRAAVRLAAIERGCAVLSPQAAGRTKGGPAVYGSYPHYHYQFCMIITFILIWISEGRNICHPRKGRVLGLSLVF
jgi:hypothetical protein